MVKATKTKPVFLLQRVIFDYSVEPPRIRLVVVEPIDTLLPPTAHIAPQR